MITDQKLLVGADTGGTFTDLVACGRDGSIVFATKVSTTPGDPSVAILEALGGLPAGAVEAFLHGTTIGTNAVLERRGARTALLTTRGFRDVLELGRQDRPHLYDWFRTKPEPLVPRELCFEIDERLAPADPAGGRPLDERQARTVIGELRARQVDSVAVCLLHAYRDGSRERRLCELLEEELPAASVSLSSDVVPEIMEYERSSTTVANAYLAPVMDRYLAQLLAGLAAHGVAAPAYLMQSSGGLAGAATIARRAVQTVLSGPAAGVIGGLASTASSARSSFLTVDMGGTSFDIAYAEDRRPAVTRESSIDGLPLSVPALDIHTLGAGGGSIAWVDGGGGLRVGPVSAGSQPGPACYGRGGEEPTVTDANVVLGRLGGELLGGRLALDVDAAHRAIERSVAKPLGLSVTEAARGVIDVVNAAMVKGMHLKSVARGHDPRAIGIVGFGGAGPLHACALAEALGSSEVIVPPLPGNTSAVGLALASVRRERSQAVLAPLAGLTDGEAAAILDGLAAEVVAGLGDDGVEPARVALQAVARVSYEGQRYQLDLPVPSGEQWPAGGRFPGTLRGLAESFRDRHGAVYGYNREEPLSLFSLVVVGLAPIGAGRATTPPAGPAATGAARTREVWLDGGFRRTPILQRGELVPRRVLDGPAVIEQADSTTVVPPRWSCAADEYGSLVLTRR